MPAWLQNQIQRAFLEKNSKQVQLLNQCWFFYKKSIAQYD
ncbi:cortex morphogenetic protein CmpA [Pradoshia sp. D12]|nr:MULTISPECIES: cortex morphogenetic protein CmpA [Bacillaceae]QFK70010.1 cortex morphogenetic protein CmpA [Pradoshia sp. D12]TPF70492.1 cortex morphogenetic protein CmpA [Bacillus sp. D12]